MATNRAFQLMNSIKDNDQILRLMCMLTERSIEGMFVAWGTDISRRIVAEQISRVQQGTGSQLSERNTSYVAGSEETKSSSTGEKQVSQQQGHVRSTGTMLQPEDVAGSAGEMSSFSGTVERVSRRQNQIGSQHTERKVSKHRIGLTEAHKSSESANQVS